MATAFFAAPAFDTLAAAIPVFAAAPDFDATAAFDVAAALEAVLDFAVADLVGAAVFVLAAFGADFDGAAFA